MSKEKWDFKRELDQIIGGLVEKARVPDEEKYSIKEKSGYYSQPEGYWKTAVSQSAPHKIFIRGYSLAELMGNLTFTQVIFLILNGELPTEKETKMLDALLNSIIDHQMVSANIPAARYTASGNPQFVPALASGILTIGANTVSPFDGAELINSAYGLMKKENLTYEETAKKIVADYRARKKRIPGFGHPTHRKYDPRTVRLFQIANELGFIGEKTRLYLAIHEEFVKTYGKGKEIPINIDGAMACVFNDLGMHPLLSTAIATLSFIPGMMAQIIEELQNPVPLRYVHECDYVGVLPRPLPKEYKK